MPNIDDVVNEDNEIDDLVLLTLTKQTLEDLVSYVRANEAVIRAKEDWHTRRIEHEEFEEIMERFREIRKKVLKKYVGI
jgi:hypothetical protein